MVGQHFPVGFGQSENAHRQTPHSACHPIAIEIEHLDAGRTDIGACIHFHAVDDGMEIVPQQTKQTVQPRPVAAARTSNVIDLRTAYWERRERLFKEAEGKFDAYLEHRRKKGEHVRVLMRPYRTGQVRAILELNGIRVRVYFCEAQDGWRKA